MTGSFSYTHRARARALSLAHTHTCAQLQAQRSEWEERSKLKLAQEELATVRKRLEAIAQLQSRSVGRDGAKKSRRRWSQALS